MQDAFCLILRLGFGLDFSGVASVFHSWYDVFPAIGVVVFPLASMLLPVMRRQHACKYLAFCSILQCFIRFPARYYRREFVKVMIMFEAGVPFVFHWFYKGSHFVWMRFSEWASLGRKLDFVDFACFYKGSGEMLPL